MDYQNYIKAEFLILIPMLMLIGSGIKHTQLINNKWIPVILGIIGCIGVAIWQLAYESVTNWWAFVLTSFIQGILTAAGAVYSNQIYKQTKE